MATYMKKFNLDALHNDCSSPEDSDDWENAGSVVSMAFDKEGDKQCHIFNFSSPDIDLDNVCSNLSYSNERESQFLKI